MKLNLPIQLSKSDFYLKRPFIIFEIHNFIDNSDYDNLVREISSFNDYNHISKGRGKKEKITFTGSNLGEIELPQFKKFVTKVISKSFFQSSFQWNCWNGFESELIILFGFLKN